MERELLAPIDIAGPDGRLRREAIGWARHPVQRCQLPPGTSRAHVWHYWCVMDGAGALTLLVADVGIAGVALLSYLDLATGRTVERVHLRPLGLAAEVPIAPRGDLLVEARGLRLALRTVGEELQIEAEARTLLGRRLAAEITVERPAAHETVNVLVPWDDTRFQFTSKQQALAARGVVRVEGRSHRLDDAFACLDFGRGRWPSGIRWSWAFAAGRVDAGTAGLNLGAEWTDGTGVTENGLVLAGRVHKIPDAVDFADEEGAWRIRTRETARVALRFTPLRQRRVRVPLVLASLDLHQCVGRFSGTLVTDDGQPLVIDRMLGLAERVRGRW